METSGWKYIHYVGIYSPPSDEEMAKLLVLPVMKFILRRPRRCPRKIFALEEVFVTRRGSRSQIYLSKSCVHRGRTCLSYCSKLINNQRFSMHHMCTTKIERRLNRAEWLVSLFLLLKVVCRKLSLSVLIQGFRMSSNHRLWILHISESYFSALRRKDSFSLRVCSVHTW